MIDQYNNKVWLIMLLELFQEHGGYWDINQSEDTNIEITWSPFIGDGQGKMLPDIHQKRVASIEDFYGFALEEIAPYIGTNNE